VNVKRTRRAIGMTLRRRVGVLATAVSGLLAAALLLSAPAFAWNSQLSDVHSRCPSNPHPDQTRVSFTVTPFQGHEDGSVSVAYSINGGDKQQVPEGGLFNQAGQKQNTFTKDDVSLDLHFFVPSPDTEGTIHLWVTTTFNDLPEGERVPVAEAETKLVVCKSTQATTSTTPTTVITPTTVVASSTTEAGGALGETTTTAGGGSLPFTGANAMPMLIAALTLVLGGGGLLIASRIRGGHAK
jgi:WD40 repeat protein